MTYVRRDDGVKNTAAVEGVAEFMKQMLVDIQAHMFARAKRERDSLIVKIAEWRDFVHNLDRKRMCLAPWCERKSCEEDIKVRSALPNGGVDASTTQLAEAEAHLSQAKVSSSSSLSFSFCLYICIFTLL